MPSALNRIKTVATTTLTNPEVEITNYGGTSIKTSPSTPATLLLLAVLVYTTPGIITGDAILLSLLLPEFLFPTDYVVVSLSPLTAVLFATIPLLTVTIHEAGHYIAVKVSGVTPQKVYVSNIAGHTTARTLFLSRRDDLLFSIGGPLASITAGSIQLLAGYMAIYASFHGLALWLFFAAALNLFAGTAQIIPIPPSDGGKALQTALSPQLTSTQITHITWTLFAVLSALSLYGAHRQNIIAVGAVVFFIALFAIAGIRK